MRNTQRRRPAVELLEGKTLLSAQGMMHVPLPQGGLVELAQNTAGQNHHAIVLNGTVKGQYTAERFNPDAGTSYKLFASGRIPHVGSSVVFGTLLTPGNLAQGRSGGTLTVISPGGSLTLQLTGPVQPGFSPLPNHFQFTITKATGKFHGDTGSGTVLVTLTPDKGAPSPGLFGPQHGALTLTFGPPSSTA
ncbi:MAG TPA: hypothetical protein VGZ22_15545 [Isosphaeraceae bacterium]|jgi:hypothetical protein|nr:hypothetical protein [Isosphaeraceae bacterium]